LDNRPGAKEGVKNQVGFWAQKKRGALRLAQNQIDFLRWLMLQHAGDHEP
jgi:hypothetical protein